MQSVNNLTVSTVYAGIIRDLVLFHNSARTTTRQITAADPLP